MDMQTPPDARISVALCTYNGERFLPEQLDSILNQTRLPDELIVCDDNSSDKTLDLLQAFADTAPFPVKIVQNKSNLGSTQNFLQAIHLCSGTLIALADQDDLWHASRLQHSEKLLLEHPEAGMTFSDGTLIDDHSKPLPGKLWTNFGFSDIIQQRLAAKDYLVCVQLRFVTGATVLFRTSLRDLCFPVGEGWIHDEWLAASAPLFSELCPLSEDLICYRLHASQQVGSTQQISAIGRLKLSLRMLLNAGCAHEKHWNEIRKTASLIQVVCTHFAEARLEAQGRDRLIAYQQFADYLVFRSNLPGNRARRAVSIFDKRKQYAQYSNYSGLGSMLKDLLLAHAPPKYL